jgi:hypothetical protein
MACTTNPVSAHRLHISAMSVTMMARPADMPSRITLAAEGRAAEISEVLLEIERHWEAAICPGGVARVLKELRLLLLRNREDISPWGRPGRTPVVEASWWGGIRFAANGLARSCPGIPCLVWKDRYRLRPAITPCRRVEQGSSQ